ncbi:hypothetical protein BsWGS_02951 [Bradybaena similaris]
MDNGESTFSKSMHSTNKGTENDAPVNNCSVSVSYGTCASLSPVDACDMTRCAPSGSLLSDSLDSSPSSLGTTQPDAHIDLQQIPSGVDGGRLVLNEGFDVEMEHSQAAVQNELHSDISGAITLDQLNDDALYHIASFLEARVLRFALSLVCRRFHAMFANETYWRTRITIKWPKPFPAVSCPSDFNWVDAYVEREDNYRVWKDAACQKYHFKYSHNLFGGVDAVHLLKEGQLAVCGDRSRTLNLIDFSKYPGPDSDEVQMQDMLCHSDRVVHQGWIWSIASAGSHLVTGSWDTYVRMFDLEAGCKLASSFKCHSSVLCLYAENNETVASCSDKKVYFFDHRTAAVRSETFHTQPVLCVAGNDNFVISGSEDKSVSVYDRRAGKIFMMFKLKNYPLCMSYTDNQLWFGDRTGALHLHDDTDGLFQHVGSYDIGHTEKMTGVVSTLGAIYTCSGDRSIKVLHPTTDPDTITTLTVHDKEIAKIDYNSGVLVSAGGDDCLGVWLPKHWGRDTYLI